jgi:phospholipase A1/A2
MKKVAILVFATCSNFTMAGAAKLAECLAIADDQGRLACYDAIANASPAIPDEREMAEVAGSQPAVEPATTRITSVTVAATETAPAATDEQEVFLSPRLDQEQVHANNRFVIIPHQRNYLLPVTYNSNINEELWNDMFPGTGMDKVEAKFQISFKAIIWEEIFGKGINLWGAYTQENWMQTYNTDASSPFRETDYQPELILAIDNNWKVLGLHNTRLDISFNHQSNGRSEPLSRSWNRLIGSAVFERNDFSLRASGWYRLPENNKDDDNPNIEDYIGRAELQGTWKWPDYSLGLTVRNNLESDNKGSVQLDWTFPLSRRFRGYIQYFNGYGESLIDYDESTNRIGIGVSLTEPL